jgi:hypothetical protein
MPCCDVAPYALVGTGVSEERIASIIMVIIGELRTTTPVTSNRRTLGASQKTASFKVTAVKTSNLTLALTGWTLYRRRNVFTMYELCFYIPEGDILHSYSREKIKSYHSLIFHNRI